LIHHSDRASQSGRTVPFISQFCHSRDASPTKAFEDMPGRESSLYRCVTPFDRLRANAPYICELASQSKGEEDFCN
jgi:hypothetical protein